MPVTRYDGCPVAEPHIARAIIVAGLGPALKCSTQEIFREFYWDINWMFYGKFSEDRTVTKSTTVLWLKKADALGEIAATG